METWTMEKLGKRTNNTTQSWLTLSFSLLLLEESQDESMPPIVLKTIPVYSDLKINIGLFIIIIIKITIKLIQVISSIQSVTR